MRLADQASPSDTDSSDAQFVASWREELIRQTWQALAQVQPTYHAVLLLRAENPDMPSGEMADRLTMTFVKPITAGNLRMTLHRTREKSANLLVEEVTKSLQAPSREALDSIGPGVPQFAIASALRTGSPATDPNGFDPGAL